MNMKVYNNMNKKILLKFWQIYHKMINPVEKHKNAKEDQVLNILICINSEIIAAGT